jgi:hypothetical protein
MTPPASAPKAKHVCRRCNKKQTAELNKVSLAAVQAAQTAHINQLTAQHKGVVAIDALVNKIVSAGQHGTGKLTGDSEEKGATLSVKGAERILRFGCGRFRPRRSWKPTWWAN